MGESCPKRACSHLFCLFYSQTEMDLESHRCIVNKQNVILFLCARVYGCHATHVLHSSNNHFPKAILFDYNPNRALALVQNLLSLWCQHKTNFLLTYEVQDKSIHWLINAQKSNNSENINSSTYELTKSPNHKLTNSPTQQFKKLKFLSFIIQIHFNFYSILAKKQVIK